LSSRRTLGSDDVAYGANGRRACAALSPHGADTPLRRRFRERADRKLRAHQVSRETIHSAVRIASTVNAVAGVLDFAQAA